MGQCGGVGEEARIGVEALGDEGKTEGRYPGTTCTRRDRSVMTMRLAVGWAQDNDDIPMKAFTSIPSGILFSLALLGGPSVSAGVVYPISATTTGGNLNPLPNYAVEYLFNEGVTGPGDTLDNTVTNHTYAYASSRPVAGGGYPVTIVADFGSAVDLGALYLWNAGNPNKAAALEKGVKDFSLTFWDGPGATGSQIGPVFTASAAPVAGWGAIQPEIPGQTFTFASSYIGVQSVEFRLINNQVEDPAQWVGVREIAFAEPKLPLELRISQSGGNLDFEWNSLAGMQYDLLGSTDLSSDPASWLPYNDGVTTHEDIPATGTTTTRTGVLKDGPVRFFALREEEIPPLLEEHFDAPGPGLPAGWVAVNATTVWDVGDPSGLPNLQNGDGTNCVGTNVVAGNYADEVATVTLTSPPVPIPAGGATLSFSQYIDSDATNGDVGAVRLLDSTDTEIVEGDFPVTGIDGIEIGWTNESYTLPPSAAGQDVKVVFEFSTNADGSVFNGFYIDDVVVTGN
jgi:hypothetical protein